MASTCSNWKPVKSGTRSVILTYHSLDPSGSVISVAPNRFLRQMEMLAGSGAPVVPLSRVAQTPGGVAITFDDAFANFLEHALPVLDRYRFPATVFVVSGFAGRVNRWAQPVSGIPELPLMTWSDLRRLPALGIALGAHTVTHPDLSRVDSWRAESEMVRSRETIEQATGAAVEAFAFPYGSRTRPVVELARKYFKVGCSTELAALGPGADALDFPRVDMFYFRDEFWFRNLRSPAGRAYLGVRRLLRKLRSH